MSEFEMLALFGEPERPAVPAPPVVKVRWSNYYAANRVQCAHCVAIVHARRGQGRIDIRTARRRRTGPDGELLLCTLHADDKHTADVAAGLVPPLKGQRRPPRKAA